jgi:multiple sugar transport system ATP-binding protein
MAQVVIRGLHKRFGAVHVVKGIDLDIEEGEFAVLVGPSGCGKTTLLRSIAGLEQVDEGTIAIGGEVVNHMRPRDRDVAMVFQNYALYPYLTVFENIAFGLRARKVPQTQIDRIVRQAAEKLEIAALLDRFPRQLSGGQRQRVAIGRAIVRNSRLFLFDEPLSNLDAQLRDEMRGEIKRLHQDIATTMIYVTHDQVEAMTLADRIVMLKDGRIEQAGSPLELFERPATRFVAGFLGSPTMNFVSVELVLQNGEPALSVTSGLTFALPSARRAALAKLSPQALTLGIRPEHLARARNGAERPGTVRFSARIDLIQPTGSRTYATFNLGGTPVVAELQAHDVQQPGEIIELSVDLGRVVLIDPKTDKVLH